MKRVAITGASGFVGANLARRMLADGHEVHLLLRPQSRTWRIEGIRPDVRIHTVSLQDGDALGRVLQEVRPEWVFHLAAYGAYAHQSDVEAIVQTNILGTVTLLEVARRCGFEAFVNTGSSSEYGFKDHAPSEREWLEPNSHYAVGKASATLFCRYTGQRYSLRVPTLRLYSVFGPFEEPTRLVPMLIARGLRGGWPPLVSPDTVRDFIHVDDVCEAYVLAASQPDQEAGAVYNIGTGVEARMREVVAVARQVLGIEAEPVWGSMRNRAWDTSRVWVADPRSAMKSLGWSPRHGFETGFRATVAWWREHP